MALKDSNDISGDRGHVLTASGQVFHGRFWSSASVYCQGWIKNKKRSLIIGSSNLNILASTYRSGQFSELRVTVNRLLCRKTENMTWGLEREKGVQEIDLSALACIQRLTVVEVIKACSSQLGTILRAILVLELLMTQCHVSRDQDLSDSRD